MARIVLFHHVLGLTDGVRAFADSLRSAGHEVVTPDLFDGSTFTSLRDGMAYVEDLGDSALMDRAAAGCEGLDPEGLVYAGFSLGVMPAQVMLQTRPGAAGAILVSAFCDPHQLPDDWPDRPIVHLYGKEHDPFLVEDGDLHAAEGVREHHGNLAITLYPGRGHLFAEPGHEDYDAATTERLVTDVLHQLADLD